MFWFKDHRHAHNNLQLPVHRKPHFTVNSLSVIAAHLAALHFGAINFFFISSFRACTSWPTQLSFDRFIFSFHLFFFYFLQSIIHTSHPLEQPRTSYPNPLYPSRNLRVFESLRYETGINVHKSLLIPRYSLPHVKSFLHSIFFFPSSRLVFLASIFFFDI